MPDQIEHQKIEKAQKTRILKYYEFFKFSGARLNQREKDHFSYI